MIDDNAWNEKDRFPAVLINWPMTQRIIYLTLIAPGEIRGWGEVETIDGTTDFFVSNILPLLNQDTREGKTNENTEDIADMMASHGNPEKIKLQWHSHGNIQAGISGEDIETIESYDNGAVDYMISLVVNKAMFYVCRVDVFNPFRLHFFAEVFTILPMEESILNSSRQEILEKVSFKGKRIKSENLMPSARYIKVPWKSFFGAYGR